METFIKEEIGAFIISLPSERKRRITGKDTDRRSAWRCMFWAPGTSEST